MMQLCLKTAGLSYLFARHNRLASDRELRKVDAALSRVHRVLEAMTKEDLHRYNKAMLPFTKRADLIKHLLAAGFLLEGFQMIHSRLCGVGYAHTLVPAEVPIHGTDIREYLVVFSDDMYTLPEDLAGMNQLRLR
eukprot:TRINITY_DN91380_c0_g1_i1.p1 TRINITY_DN91380_c0_g1~~TRINITY_DN91380_c0_g1_i1.p1  ORF type:complete len:135 (-),score=3.79 TRINITY_DN91380_c0_g1_i1:97-501(-)